MYLYAMFIKVSGCCPSSGFYSITATRFSAAALFFTSVFPKIPPTGAVK